MTRAADERTDEALALAACGGDREAYGLLVGRHLRQVYGVALRITGRAAEAEDVAQDACLRAYERLGQYKSEFPFKHWLLRITANLAINRLRSRRREKKLHEAVAERQAGRDAERLEAPSPREWQHWLDQLDELPRAAIVLFHFQEMSYAEIAEVLDKPVNTVRTYIHRGRKRLRELMGGESRSEKRSWNVVM